MLRKGVEMKGSLKIGKIAGIEIGIHYTWIFAFFLFGFSLAQTFISLFKWNNTQAWVAGFVCTVLLFLSVLAHELAHSLVAKGRGLPVSSITLFIFGGVSNLSEEPQTAGTEFTMAIVGPLTSLILGIVFWIAWFFMSSTWRLPILMDIGIANVSFVAALLGILAYMNLGLAIFNLIPGFPLDGGRVLRAIIWNSTKDLVKATNIAANIGKYLGWIFIGAGVYFILFQGHWLSGLWIAIIGMFLSNAAENSLRETTIRQHLTGVTVSQLMETNTDTVNQNISIANLVQDVFMQNNRRSIPVTEGQKLVGIVTMSDVRKVTQDVWPVTPVSRIMSKDKIHTVKPADQLNDALKLITQFDLNQLPVIDDNGKILGVINRTHIVNYLHLKSDLSAVSAKPKKI
jgi:Zn-dependent protease/CBS domain-containing protein